MEEFLKESKSHGWPSFRDEEVVWENVRCLKDGEAVSLAEPTSATTFLTGKAIDTASILCPSPGVRCDITEVRRAEKFQQYKIG